MLLTPMIFIPLIGMAVILCLPSRAHGAIRWTAVAATVPPIFYAWKLLATFEPSAPGYQFVERASWIPPYNIEYFVGVDGLSITMVLLTALLCFLCMFASFGITNGVKGYFALFLLLDTGMMGVFCALDFFLFFVFWEMMLLPMYFLIGVWGGPRREYAAIKFFLYTLLGSVLLLVSILYFYFAADPHTFDMTVLGDALRGRIPMHVQMLLWVALFVGFAIKIPAFPFHTWLPDAHVEAPTAISVILAGVLLKMGTYGILRINYGILPEATLAPFWAGHSVAFWLLAALGTVNIIYGAMCAMAQTDLKKLVAYSSISHMGYVMLGMAAFTPQGINGAVLQMFNHGTITAMLFLLVGVIYDRAHHRNIDGFGGLASILPVYTGVTGLAFFAAMGLPGLSAFISEVLVLLGAWQVYPALTVVAASAVVLTAGYMLWALQRVYLGSPNEKYRTLPDINGRELFTLIPLGAIVIFLGVYPRPILDLQSPALLRLNARVRAAVPAPAQDLIAATEKHSERMGTVESLVQFYPELALSGAVLAVILIDVMLRGGSIVPGLVALLGSLLALVLTTGLPPAGIAGLITDSAPSWLFGRMLVLDGFSLFFKVLLGLALVMVVWMSLHSREVRGRANEGEYYALLLSSGLGMFLMAGAANLLMAYLSLEFVSLTSYVLTGFLRHNRRSGEAALKYLIYGGVASGAMIYGMSWIFGLTGAMDYPGIARGVAHLDPASRPAMFLALILVFTGFGYKISMVPFHMWAPDVYTGAPIPVTAFLAVGSKAAGFAMLLRFFHFGVAPSEAAATLGRLPLVELGSLLCVATMTLGNLAALSQTNLKRLLAYSSIAHAGYALLGFVVFAEAGVQAVLFYLAVYYTMNLGAFWVVMLVANATGREDIEGYRGLAWRGGALASVAFAVFLFSLAGLPPLAGFLGKFYVFAAGVEGRLYALVVIGLVNSVVSLYYYARVVKVMFLDRPEPDDPPMKFRLVGDLGVVGVLAAVNVVLILRFDWLLSLVQSAGRVFSG